MTGFYDSDPHATEQSVSSSEIDSLVRSMSSEVILARRASAKVEQCGDETVSVVSIDVVQELVEALFHADQERLSVSREVTPTLTVELPSDATVPTHVTFEYQTRLATTEPNVIINDVSYVLIGGDAAAARVTERLSAQWLHEQFDIDTATKHVVRKLVGATETSRPLSARDLHLLRRLSESIGLES